MMRELDLKSALALLLALSACTSEPLQTPSQGRAETFEEISTASSGAGAVPGMAYVRLSEDAAAAVPPGAGLRRLFPDAGEFEARHRAAGLHRWFVASFDPATKADDALRGLDGVEVIEDVPAVGPCSVDIPFNDPLARERQWHLANDGSLLGGFTHGADIDVVPVWEQFTAGSKDVIVAVIDTGTDASHPDLNASVIPDGENGSRNFIYDWSSTPYETRPERHGTHTAGIIGAVNNNGIGICGIAGGSDGTGGVRILSLQALATDHSGSTEQALVWAADHGAVIANNSWNYVYDSESDVPSSTPLAIRTAIDYFIKHAGFDSNGEQTGPMAGGLVLFSAGNKQWAKGQPAMYEKVIAVGATGPDGKPSGYTNYGDWVDICAPGGHYEAFYNNLAMIYGCVPGGSYDQMQGTSQACPMVSGVAALLVSYFGGPGFTPEMLKEKLLGGASAQKTASHSKAIGPALDAYGSFIYTNDAPEPLSDFTVAAGEGSLHFKWTVQEQCGASVSGYVVAVSEDKSLVENFDPLSDAPEGVTTADVYTENKAAGATVTKSIYRLKDRTAYWCVILAKGRNGKYSAPSEARKAFIGSQGEPEIHRLDAGGTLTVPYNGCASVECAYSDPDSDPLTLDLDSGGAAAQWSEAESGRLVLTITGNDVLAGNYIASARVSDPFGGSAQISIPYVLTPNHCPEITAQIPDIAIGLPGVLEFDALQYFSDPDSDDLTVSVSCQGDCINAAVLGGGRVSLAGVKEGDAVVSVTATDPGGKSAVQSFKVLAQGDDICIYPNPVHDNLYIRPISERSATVTLLNPAGKRIFCKSVISGPFVPYYINMSACATGVYTVKVEFDGNEVVRQVVKY